MDGSFFNDGYKIEELKVFKRLILIRCIDFVSWIVFNYLPYGCALQNFNTNFGRNVQFFEMMHQRRSNVFNQNMMGENDPVDFVVFQN